MLAIPMAFRKLNQRDIPREAGEPPPKVGRPGIYDARIIDEILSLATQGYSIAELIHHVACGSRRTWDKWKDDFPDFFDATLRARDLALAWWEAQARKGIDSREFNANLYKIAVCARFPDHGYKDMTIQQTVAPQAVDLAALSPEEREALAVLLTKAQKAHAQGLAAGGLDSGKAAENGGKPPLN